MTTPTTPATPTTPGPPAPGGTRGPRASLAGTGPLLRLALRTDRVLVAVWAGAVGLLTATSVAGLDEVYGTAELRAARATLISSPAATALAGPGYGLDDYTLGAMTANELLLWVLVPVGVMAVLAVSRHLRAPEEDGRLELVRSLPVGPAAPVVAGLLAAVAQVLVVGAALLLGLLTTGLAPGGAVLFSAAVVAAALVLAAATAVAAQLTEHARTSSATGLALLGAAVVLRGAGDVEGARSTSVWTWLSPVGWSQATAPWTLDRWWPLAPSVVACAAGLAVAALLARRRDLGTGLLPDRPGPAHGRLGGVLALTWRRRRAALLGWGVGVVGLGALVGVLASAVVDLVADDPDLRALLGAGADAVTGVLAVYVVLLAVLAAASAATAVHAARADELTGRAAALLALPVGRVRWLGAQCTLAAGAAVLALLLAGLAAGIGTAATTHDATMVARLVGAAAVAVPGVLVVLGAALVVHGLVPRASGLVWLYVAYVGVVGLFGPLLPDGTDVLSPFTHLPRLPAAPTDPAAVVAVTGVAAVLWVAGLVGWRWRDVQG